MAKLKYLLASLLVISATLLSALGVSASTIVQKQEVPKNLQVIQTATNNYSVQVGANVISLGSATSSFTPAMTFPDWQGYAWNAQLGLTMAVPGNALAMAGMTSSSTSTSVTASNSYFSITYSGVAVNPPFNETGGLDMSINILKNIGTTLAFGYNSTNVNAYVQPPLTSEWTVGQQLGNGNTVASVTATDVTDNQGNNVAHRPIYVVGSIALCNASAGGMVTTAQAATGLTTGQMGMLYALICHDSSAVQQTGYATWSISGSNFTLTLPTFTNPVYPIVLSPAGDTFGYTTAGSTSWTGAFPTNNSNQGTAGFFPSPGAETISNLNIYANFTVAGNYVELGVYTDSSAPVIFKTNSNTAAISVGTSAAWVSVNPIGSASVAASTNYDIAVQISSSISITAYYNSGTYNQSLGGAYTYGTWGNLASWAFHPNFTNRNISIYCTCTAGGGVTISNSPSSVSFGTVMPGTTYYSYNQSTGSYPNPVTSSQCHFTITNGGSGSVNLAMSCSNATTGNTWTLVSSAPSGDQFEVIAVYNGENPASGLVLTNSNQSFYSGLTASGTLLWDFEEILGGTGTGKSGTFSDSATKTYTITITGS